MRKLFSLVALCLLLTGSAMAALPSAPTPQIWFSMGALTSPAGHQSWDALFYEPDAPWPEFTMSRLSEF